jgi:hypothetical protein
MPPSDDARLMDTEPGGENTPYEASCTFGQAHAKQRGQFKGEF